MRSHVRDAIVDGRAAVAFGLVWCLVPGALLIWFAIEAPAAPVAIEPPLVTYGDCYALADEPLSKLRSVTIGDVVALRRHLAGAP